jgi:hypothetical protein
MRLFETVAYLNNDSSCIHKCSFFLTYCCSRTMAIRVLEFSSGGTKLERFMSKNQHTQRKLSDFENWVNREVSTSAKI